MNCTNGSGCVLPPAVACPGLTPTFWAAFDIVHDGVYYGLAPFFFVFGLTGQLLCLVAFLKESKRDKAYVYQIFVSISQANEVFWYTVYVLTLKLGSGVERDSALWFKNNFFLMWYVTHFATVTYNTSASTSLLVALAMAIDRMCALVYPHTYKNWNHRRNQVIAITFSFSWAFATSIFAIWRFQLLDSDNPAEGLYKVVFNVPFASTKYGSGLSYVRNMTRIVAVSILSVINVINLRLFRSRVMKIGSDDAAGPNVAKAKNTKQTKQEAERTLFILVIAESSLAAVAMMAISTYLFAIFIFPTFTNCGGLMLSALVDMVLNLCNMGKFYIVLAMDKRFRRMIFRAITRQKALNGQTMTVAQTTTVTRGRLNRGETMAEVGSA